MLRYIIIANALLGVLLTCSAQSLDEVQEMLPQGKPKRSYYSDEVSKENSIGGMLYFYKNYISSQDASSCSFAPSCSEYAAEAIKKQGFIRGLINFGDRFQRCHGEDADQYIYLKESHLLYDPVRNINYEEL